MNQCKGETEIKYERYKRDREPDREQEKECDE